ncbi:hypothetical protein JCM8097_003216 [Rhodosporidiobolus ruineniae]
MPSMPSVPFVPRVLTINYSGQWENPPRSQRLKLDLQSPITFNDLLGEMWEPFDLTHRSQPECFRATRASPRGRPYEPRKITNNEELQTFLVSTDEEDELLLQTAWHDKTFIKLGVHPCYGTASLQPRATMQDLVNAGQALYGNETAGEAGPC